MALLLLVSVFLLPSCKKKNNEEGEETTSVSTEGGENVEDKRAYYRERFGNIDMQGKELWIYDLNTSPDMHVNFYDEFQGDPMNVKLYERELFFEDLYGISIENFSNTAGANLISNAVLSDSYIADIIYGRASGDRLMTLAQKDCLADMIGNDQIDTTQPWWSQFMSESLTINDRLFFTSGDILPTFYQSIGCFYYNIDLGGEAGIDKDALCSTVTDGKFTWEYMMKLVANYGNDGGDGVYSADVDTFGCITYNVYNHTNMWAIGAGVDLVTQNTDGDYIVDYKSPSIEAILADLKGYITLTDMGANGVDSIMQTTFKEGRAIFAEHFTESGFNQIRGMSDDYLMLPVPKVYESQDTYRCMVNSYVNCFVGIISNCADTEMTGAMLESMAHYGYNEIRPVAYEEFLKATLARDPAATEITDIIFDTAYIDYGVIDRLGEDKNYPNGAGDILYNYLKLDAPLVSAFEKYEQAINGDLQKALEPFTK